MDLPLSLKSTTPISIYQISQLFSGQKALDNDKAKWSKKEQLINSFAKVFNSLKTTSVFTPTELIIVHACTNFLY